MGRERKKKVAAEAKKITKACAIKLGAIGTIILVASQVMIVSHYLSKSASELATGKQQTAELASVYDRLKSSSKETPRAEVITTDQGGQSLGNDGVKSLAADSCKTVAKAQDEKRAQADAPWRKSKVLPQWMKDYFQWHQASLQNLTADNVNDYDYLVYRCLESDQSCGGGADRLKPLPLLLLLGSKLNRLVFYYWEKPAPLEAFLVPPPDGLDWRWPPHPSLADHDFSAGKYLNLRRIRVHLGLDAPNKQGREASDLSLSKVESVRFQSDGHGKPEYDKLRADQETEYSYDVIFRDCWNSVFVPSPPVQKLIDYEMDAHQLKPDEYHAIHIRSLYFRKFDWFLLTLMARNALNCLYTYLLQTGTPLQASTAVFVATDSYNTTLETIEYARTIGLKRVVARCTMNTAKPTLHLDRGQTFLGSKTNDWTNYDASSYYDTFVDLYLLSQARCIVFNVGNFGKWANLLSSNSSCQYNHMKDKSCPVIPAHTFG